MNYGLGNIRAFADVYRRLDIPVDIATDPSALANATRLILPGVGAFDWAMTRLNNSGLRVALDDAVLERKVPVLGVCVGLQMMARSSEEGQMPGLGWIDADVRRMSIESARLPLPHMGWNDVYPMQRAGLFSGLEGTSFYFLHSFHVVPRAEDTIAAVAQYGTLFCAAVSARNVHGTQFHPEKSHQAGIALLRNFASL